MYTRAHSIRDCTSPLGIQYYHSTRCLVYAGLSTYFMNKNKCEGLGLMNAFSAPTLNAIIYLLGHSFCLCKLCFFLSEREAMPQTWARFCL